ncbi:MAG: hypothetical protein AB7J28_06420 [Hyphomonadaceae bacterium]
MLRRFAIKPALALAALLALGNAASAQVPPNYAAQLAVQLSAVEQTMARQGFRRVPGTFTGILPQGGARGYTFTLQAGAEYRVVGVCDRACGDLDLRLFDQGGGLITEDTGPGTVPNVSSIPRWTGRFSVQALMPSCGVRSGCYFALNLYAR